MRRWRARRFFWLQFVIAPLYVFRSALKSVTSRFWSLNENQGLLRWGTILLGAAEAFPCRRWTGEARILHQYAAWACLRSD